MVQSLLDLANRTSVEAEFDVSKMYVAKLSGDEKTKPTTTKLLSEYCEAIKAMLTVHLALKLGKLFFCSENYHARSQAINAARSQSPSSSTCV